jgi:hypothetical protein
VQGTLKEETVHVKTSEKEQDLGDLVHVRKMKRSNASSVSGQAACPAFFVARSLQYGP